MNNWINRNTKGSKSVIELGAGFFQNLEYVNESCKVKIGIEIWQPYIDNAKYNDCIKIQGDLLNYKELLNNTTYFNVYSSMDTVMICDVLEHLDKEVGIKLIKDLKKDFRKILLMIPIGKFEQNEDITGFGAHEYQTHRSYWYKEDINKLYFNRETFYVEHFHDSPERLALNLPTCAWFGVWEKIESIDVSKKK